MRSKPDIGRGAPESCDQYLAVSGPPQLNK
jgi:hypothetical protein